MNDNRIWKCINCESVINQDDNFCHNCGHYTSKGHEFLKDERNLYKIVRGSAYKQDGHTKILAGILVFSLIIFTIISIIRGNDMFKPYAYVKKQVISYIYGYNTSVISTNNQYKDEKINEYNDAINLIKKDFDKQYWQCSNNIKVSTITYELQKDLNIPSVSFCDMSLEEANKISKVIKEMYNLFPNIKGALSNISITNAPNNEYIARFQPKYQFVNSNQNLNKVNKTQILLNSYYFLNDNYLNTPIEKVIKDKYVKDATLESTISHEIGHYISFYTLLKQNKLENIFLENDLNKSTINTVITEYENNIHSNKIVNLALKNYNTKNQTNLTLNEFTNKISNYASTKTNQNEINTEETIAEAIHDYYLHKNKASATSLEIVNIIKGLL